jgi:hypothetical protein
MTFLALMFLATKYVVPMTMLTAGVIMSWIFGPSPIVGAAEVFNPYLMPVFQNLANFMITNSPIFNALMQYPLFSNVVWSYVNNPFLPMATGLVATGLLAGIKAFRHTILQQAWQRSAIMSWFFRFLTNLYVRGPISFLKKLFSYLFR